MQILGVLNTDIAQHCFIYCLRKNFFFFLKKNPFCYCVKAFIIIVLHLFYTNVDILLLLPKNFLRVINLIFEFSISLVVLFFFIMFFSQWRIIVKTVYQNLKYSVFVLTFQLSETVFMKEAH